VFCFIRSKFDEAAEWGLRITNGSWNGMIGRLLKGEADVALSDFHMSVDRLEVVDFLFTLQTTS
jgi:hypothetical protein